MKEIRYGIMLLAGFCLGFAGEAGMGIAMRKAANSRFLDETQVTLSELRQEIAQFRRKEGKYPSGVKDLLAQGYLDPNEMPEESMQHQGRWVSSWDGEGGFLYLSPSGEIYDNADVSREKFFRSDWARVLDGSIFPKGKIF